MKRVTTYGLETATDHVFSYLGRYMLLGILPIAWVACTVPWMGITVILTIAHFVSVAILFPGSLLISMLAMRIARSRTWDLQPWRAWVAAVLAVVLNWGGVLLLGVFEIDAPEFLRATIGPVAATFVHLLGFLMLAS